MKQLRILTGAHAGTQLSLPLGMSKIGVSAEADLKISDWSQASVSIEVLDMEGATSVTWRAEGAGHETPCEDFVPLRFAEVVFCIGPSDSAWPSDVALLERLMHGEPMGKQAGPSAGRSRRPWMLALGLLLLVPMLYGFTSLISKHVDGQASQNQESLVGQVFNAVQGARIDGVIVRASGSHVVVEGLVDTSAAAVALRNTLSEFPAELIEHRYAPINEISQSIGEALGNASLKVSYVSHGRFLVSGEAVHADQLQNQGQRIVADLAPLVTRIDFAVRNLPPPPRQSVGAMLSTQGVEYVQTGDGIKHLSVLPTPLVELTD